jgi:tetratricopeptide (TPR) repeat protein
MTATHAATITDLARAREMVQSGRRDQAQALLAAILQADAANAGALHLSGVVAALQGAHRRAAELIAAAIHIDPANADAHADLGVVLKRLGEPEAALRCYEQAIARNPAHAEAHNNRGNSLRDLGRVEAALSSYQRAIAVNPRYAEAHHNLGAALFQQHRWAEALAHYDQAIALRPDYANCLCSRGLVRERLGQPAAALADYERAIAVDGGFVQALINRGNVLRELGQPDAAVASCDRALGLSPDNGQAHQNRALALLLAGDYERGWPEFEWRWRNPHSGLGRDVRPYRQPLWLGQQDLAGKTLLVYAEQGLGDTLQFCRYVTLAAARGATVILEVPAQLLRLVQGLEGAAECVTPGGASASFDYHCPLLSLPLAFRTTLATVPARVPYLRADPADAQRWRERLGPGVRPRVGLVWSGGFRPEQPELWAVHSRRNIPLAQLAPLRAAPVEFYSLQKGQPAEAELADRRAHGWDGPPVLDLTAELRDFADTAALVSQLDLVISVDTSTAHLAAAMGKPVWLMNRFDSCWRWGLERSDSPWYPTLRLYRQPHPGAWEPVVQRVAGDLDAFRPER